MINGWFVMQQFHEFHIVVWSMAVSLSSYRMKLLYLLIVWSLPVLFVLLYESFVSLYWMKPLLTGLFILMTTMLHAPFLWSLHVLPYYLYQRQHCYKYIDNNNVMSNLNFLYKTFVCCTVIIILCCALCANGLDQNSLFFQMGDGQTWADARL